MPDISITFGSDAAASGSSSTITRTATFGAGETIAVLAHWASSTVTATVADDAGNTYTPQTVVTEAGIMIRRQQWFTTKNVAAGSPTITVTFSAGVTNRHVAYFRVTNPSLSADPQDADGRAQLNPGTGTDAATTNAMTPTSQPNGVLATCTTYVGANTVTQGTGYTDLGVLTAWNALAGDTSRIEFKRTTSTSDQTGTFTIGGATETTMAMGLVLTEVAGPTIDTQPVSQTIYVGQQATFTVSATSSGGALSYQWQVNTGSGFNNVTTGTGGTTTSFTTQTANGSETATGYTYRCNVTDSNGTVATNEALLTVINAAGTFLWRA